MVETVPAPTRGTPLALGRPGAVRFQISYSSLKHSFRDERVTRVVVEQSDATELRHRGSTTTVLENLRYEGLVVEG